MGFLLKTDISDVFISPLRGLIILWWFKRRALPDVNIYKAYGLFS